MAPRPRPVMQRLMARVEKDATTGCWVFTGSGNLKGYGQIYDGRRYAGTHRVAYLELVGPIPEGMDLDHLCRNRRCCNPAHLEPVTRRENLLRGEGLNAKNAQKTHCPQGHEYTDENTYHRPDRPGLGGRMCRICTAEAGRRHHARKRSLDR